MQCRSVVASLSAYSPGACLLPLHWRLQLFLCSTWRHPVARSSKWREVWMTHGCLTHGNRLLIPQQREQLCTWWAVDVWTGCGVYENKPQSSALIMQHRSPLSLMRAMLTDSARYTSDWILIQCNIWCQQQNHCVKFPVKNSLTWKILIQKPFKAWG